MLDLLWLREPSANGKRWMKAWTITP